MIPRRLAQNLKEQNWTAIGIDFVIVGLGVFVGIDALTATRLRTVVPMRQNIVDVAVDRGYSLMGKADEQALVERIGSDPTLAVALATSREVAAIYLVMISAFDRKAHGLVQFLERSHP